MQNNIKNIITAIYPGIISGIGTGIISSIIVSEYYRRKDRLRDKLKYLNNVMKCMVDINFECIRLLNYDTEYINYKVTIDIIRNLRSIEKPIAYKWIKLSTDENKCINKFDEVYSDIMDYTGSIFFYYDEMDGLENNYISSNDETLTDELYKKQLRDLIIEIQLKKQELDHKCSEFKELIPMLNGLIEVNTNKSEKCNCKYF